MSKHQEKYKKKTLGFGNFGTVENRLLRTKRCEDSRKDQRMENFNKSRNINFFLKKEDKVVQSSNKGEDRRNRFLKWKADRERAKKIQQSTKKPAFVVGIVRHKIYSPAKTEKNTMSTVKHQPVTKRISKATEKRLANKALANKANINQEQKYKKEHEKPVTNNSEVHTQMPTFGRVVMQSMSPATANILVQPSVSKLSLRNESIKLESTIKENDVSEESSVEDISLKLSFDENEISDNNISNNNDSSNDSNSLNNNSKEHNHSVQASSLNNTYNELPDSICEPVSSTPYIDNVKKEEQLKHSFSLGHSSSDDILTKDTALKNFNVSVDEEERTAQYFQFLLNKETDRLNKMCKKWMKIKTDPETTEDGQYEINQAIGQTNLLINKKFETFYQLIADCETGKGEMLITCKDLQGFWDMMYIEVKNCDLRFEKLEKLSLQGWKEEELLVDRPITKKETIVRKKVAHNKSSSIRAFLAEKRRMLAEETRNDDNSNKFKSNLNQIASNKYERNETPSTRYKKKSISIGAKENKFTQMKYHKRLSLLQQVQLFEGSKEINSPLTVIKVSQMYKTPEIVRLNNTITYFNSDQTPGKSILKQPKNTTKIELKSTHKVNFDDHVLLSLSEVDSPDVEYSDKATINTERKLVFDGSLKESKNDIKHSENKTPITKSISKIPSIQIQMATPLQESNKNFNTPPRRRSIRRQNAIDESDEILNKTSPLNESSPASFKETTDDTDLNVLKGKLQKHVYISNEKVSENDESIRVLRNRIVTLTDTPRSRRSSRQISINVQQPEHKENKTPSGRRKKSFFNINTYDSNERVDVHNNDDTYSEENSDKRRFTRSVKFSEKEGNGDEVNKPALPTTPHVRRNRTQTYEKRRSTITEDLISWETPEKRSG